MGKAKKELLRAFNCVNGCKGPSLKCLPSEQHRTTTSFASLIRMFRPPPPVESIIRGILGQTKLNSRISEKNYERKSLIPLSIINSTFKGFVNDKFVLY